MLSAKKVLWSKENKESVSGTVVYELDDPDERQDFIWHVSENDVPNSKVTALATLLKEKELLNLDKIIISRCELREQYGLMIGRVIPIEEFSEILSSLLSIEVSMIDDGRETDIFFIHE